MTQAAPPRTDHHRLLDEDAALAVTVDVGKSRYVRYDVAGDGGRIWELAIGRVEPALPGETATAQALRHAVDERLDDPTMTKQPWRVLVWSDPRPGAQPDGEWTTLTDAPDPLPPDTRAMPNGTELPGECWNARLLREERERAAGEPTSAQPVTFLTLALDGAGEPLADLDGVLYFDVDALEVGAWRCNGIGYHLDVPAGDHLSARRWAVRKLAERGQTVISWQLHRDSIRSFWVPTIAGRQS